MELDTWAMQWAIPAAAMIDLRNRLGMTFTRTTEDNRSEAAIQNVIRLEAAEKGCYLWRNNVGATYTKEGNFIRYGLANDSKGVNTIIKSADLIGIRPVMVTARMVGMTIGQFLSREIKAANWRYSGNGREQAQVRWAQFVLSLGGDACFANERGTI